MPGSSRPRRPLPYRPAHQLGRVGLDHPRPHTRPHALPVALRLDEAGLYQLLEVVRDGGLRHRHLVADTLIHAIALRVRDRLQDAEPPRIRERLGDALELARLETGVLLGDAHCTTTIEQHRPVGKGGTSRSRWLTAVVAGSVCVAACAHPTLRGLRIQPTEALRES